MRIEDDYDRDDHHGHDRDDAHDHHNHPHPRPRPRPRHHHHHSVIVAINNITVTLCVFLSFFGLCDTFVFTSNCIIIRIFFMVSAQLDVLLAFVLSPLPPVASWC